MKSDLIVQAQAKKAHGDFKGAIGDYNQVIAQDPKNVAAYLGRATIFSLEGDYVEALADDTKAITLDPKNAAAYTNRGNVHLYQGTLSDALADFNKAISLDPHHVRAFINRGSLRNQQKKYAAAIEDYSTAIAIDPKNAVAFYDRAGAKRSLGDYAGAKTDYSEAIQLSPKDVPAYINRAVLEIAQRDWPAATADLNKCIDLLPPEKQAYPRIYLWVAAIKQGDHKKAARDLNFNEAVSPDKWGWQIVEFLDGYKTEAQFLALAASAQSKKNLNQEAQAYYYAGMKRVLAGNQAGAAKFFSKSISLGNSTLHEYILAKAELKISAGGNQ